MLSGTLTLEIAADSIAENAGPAATSATVRLDTPDVVQRKLTASDGAAGDYFGNSVSLSGTTAFVGAHLDDDRGNNSGSVYVFEELSGTWSQVAKLTASDGRAGDYFGYSVCVSGSRAIVGAYLDDDTGNSSGSAYVFERSGGTWIQVAKLIANDGAAEDYFGNAVSISGTTAIVGAYGDADNGSSSGSAYVFEELDGTWSQVAKLTAGDGAAGDYFGNAVSISGTTAIVSAYLDDDAGNNSGSTYVFESSGGTWNQVAKITAGDGAEGDYFGYSVSISGSTAFVGAYGDDDQGDNSGSTYVFDATSGTWSQIAKLTAGDGAAGDNFGNAVSVSGTTAFVGAYGDDDSGDNSGSAYVFEAGSGTWSEVGKLTASDGATYDNFGNSVAISGTTAFVGAYLDDEAGNNSGVVWMLRGTEVQLSSDDESEAAVPATVSVWGQNAATFGIDAVDDSLVDETQVVTITANATGCVSGTDTLDVTDNESQGWHNWSNPYDVDGDGMVQPLDVLILINWINVNLDANGVADPQLPDPPAHPPPFLDVNNDNACTASDVLAVTNELNRDPAEAGEGEAVPHVDAIQTRPKPTGDFLQNITQLGAFDAVFTDLGREAFFPALENIGGSTVT